jgi:hypothetical protein
VDDVKAQLLQARVLIPDLIFDFVAHDADAFGDPRLKRDALGTGGTVRVAAKVVRDLQFEAPEVFTLDQLPDLVETAFRIFLQAG